MIGWPGRTNMPQPPRPVISHETANFNTFPRVEKGIADLTPPHGKASKFTKPFWLKPMRDQLQAAGLLAENELWSLRSEQLYASAWKTQIEGIRAQPYVSGFEWWLFAGEALLNRTALPTFEIP